MALEREYELLDDYLTNRLQGNEKDAFEKQLENNPDLKKEQQLQQGVIEGIKNARIAELKLMLNNTPVPPIQGGQAALLTKVAAWLVVAGVMSAGIYFYFNQDEKEKEATAVSPIPNKPFEQPKEIQTEKAELEVVQPEEKKTESVVIEKSETKKTTKKVEQKIVKQEDLSIIDSKAAETKVAERQKPDVYDPTGESENSTAPENDAVKPKSNDAKILASKIEVTTDNSNKKYSFHYQFKNGKLFLYGSFEQNLYEIMEFFSGNKRTLFLFYKDSYYLLNEEDVKIKPLTMINDPVLMEKLKEYRANN